MHVRFWLFFVFACFAVALRDPNWWIHPQFYAEDGSLFFNQQVVSGAGSLFTVYAGYLHVIPRLIAWGASLCPIVLQPLVYETACVLITGFAAAFFVLPECRFILKSDELRMAVAVLALVDCNAQDVFANVATLQVVLVPVGLILLASNRDGVWRAILTCLLVLTSPGLVIFLPLAIWRAVRQRHLVSFVFALCAATQAVLIATHPVIRTAATYAFWIPLEAAFESWIYRGVLCTLVGLDGAMWAGRHDSLVVACLIFGAVSVLLTLAYPSFPLRSQRGKVFWFSLVASLGLLLETFVVRRELLAFFTDPDVFFLSRGDRYFFMSVCLLLLTAALVIEELGKKWPPGTQIALMLALFAAGTVSNYRLRSNPDLHWAQQALRVEQWQQRRTGPVIIPVNPDTWYIRLP